MERRFFLLATAVLLLPQTAFAQPPDRDRRDDGRDDRNPDRGPDRGPPGRPGLRGRPPAIFLARQLS
jgi:hypothetical protein